MFVPVTGQYNHQSNHAKDNQNIGPAMHNFFVLKIQLISSTFSGIDSLHLANHKKTRHCADRYSGAALEAEYKDLNTMSCEQTFCWLGWNPKIVNVHLKTKILLKTRTFLRDIRGL